ncbi:hypothetical protein [Methanogenium sp. MK-MG]|uniref:hypothetical protein n=1 Tax=Methanogenium sp. MK-MG TaxID=2599926 RepID=UPI0013ECDC97|nr:hypothetical protein [Methanogenium sp. MK-MG]KAF1078374.1 hypothetical protein MKMG_00708 [Methanogenium sp. MK-MG]
MEPYLKIFADDLNSGRNDAQSNGIRTLSERKISKCLFCGALTEIPDTNKPVLNLTLYDPTGMLVVGCHTGNPDISSFLNETALPVFVLCAAGIRCTADECMPVLESIVPVSRTLRDGFVVAAAADLIGHLEHADTSPDKKERICGMAEKALSTLLTKTEVPATPDTAVFFQVKKEIRDISDDKKTVGIEVLIEAMGLKGIPRETTLAVLKTMIDDGDCYQPKPDVVRLL